MVFDISTIDNRLYCRIVKVGLGFKALGCVVVSAGECRRLNLVELKE